MAVPLLTALFCSQVRERDAKCLLRNIRRHPFHSQVLRLASSLCPEGQYNASGTCRGQSKGPSEMCFGVCASCTRCESEHRRELQPCSEFSDAQCGACVAGFFLGLADDKCQECSLCPDGRDAVHWLDCENAGLPLDWQCAPGECALRQRAFLLWL